jgi:DHA2 family multidrug resistance protein
MLAGEVTAGNPATAEYMARLQDMGMNNAQALGYMQNELIATQGSLLATNWLMDLSALMMLVLMVIIWFAKPPFIARRAE